MQGKKKHNKRTNKTPKFLSEMYTVIFIRKMSPFLRFALKYFRLQKKNGGNIHEWQYIGNC